MPKPKYSPGAERHQGARGRTGSRWSLFLLLATACRAGPPPTPAELTWRDADGLTALHHAARQGRTGRARLLLDHGAAIDATDRQERTPLHLAAIGGHTRTTRLLIERGAALERRAWFDLTPLHVAAMLGHAQVVDLLLARGAALEATDFYGRTPLHLAADNATVKTLLARGARLGATDHDGRTPLHLVRNEGAAKALVDAGADALATARDGQRPLDMTIAVSEAAPTLLVFPGAGAVRLRGERATLTLEVHNVSAETVREVGLLAESHAALVDVTPASLPAVYPGQIARFALAFARRLEVEPGEHLARLAVVAGGARRVELQLPLDSRRELTPEDQGMIRVGTVRVQAAPEPWQYVAYGSGPLVLLALWLLGRRRTRPAPPET